MDYSDLLPFCKSDTQRRHIQALIDHGSRRKAARALRQDKRRIEDSLSRVRKHATAQGYSPDHDMVHPVPEGFHVRGVSTYYNDEGNPVGQWVKSSADKAFQEQAMREAVQALQEDIKPASAVSPPKRTEDDLCACYIITDYHIGQLSWGDETGEDWDTDIAEDMLDRWFGVAIQSAPAADTAILAQLGDMLHWDGMDAVTPTSGHLLDADTRFQKLVCVVIRLLRKIICRLLQKHKNVRVLMCEGNHDMASSIWLREMFATFYENEPRVIVDTSPKPYYCVEWGNTSLFFHHGHKSRLSDVSRVFAGMFREVFGRTKYSYAHTGHLHHSERKEDQLMIVEQHPTIAARDAHASRGGYAAQRGAQQVTYSKQAGEVGRSIIRPEMVIGDGQPD